MNPHASTNTTSIHKRLDTISEAGSFDYRGNPAYKEHGEYGRAPYSQSTSRSPVVSDRVAKALAERRISRVGGSRVGGSRVGGSENGFGNGGNQNYDRGGDSKSNMNSNGTLNSARLREHNETEHRDRDRSRGVAGAYDIDQRSSNKAQNVGRGGYHSPDRHIHSNYRDHNDDTHTEGGYSIQSNRSVAESIMSKAMSRRGSGY